MDAELAVDLFWISATLNLSTALFFAGRGLAGWLTGRFAEASGSWRRSLLVLQEEKPWFLPRFFVIVVQSAVLCLAGFALILQGEVFRHPFYGLSSSGRACFAINIGCYMYLLVQDAILQRHLVNYYISFVHHLVAAVVYLVFLEYKQNALGGAVGLLFAGATPFFEMPAILKELHVDEHHAVYGCIFAVSGLAAISLRFLLPVGLIVYSYTITSPFTMDILVIACYFLSIVFFGMLNLWFVYCAGASLRANYRARRAWTYMRPLRTGKPHGLDLNHERCKGRVSFTSKRNDLHFLAPCSNTNLAPNNLQGSPAQNTTKNYHKINITAFLKTLNTNYSGAVSTRPESIAYTPCPELQPFQTSSQPLIPSSEISDNEVISDEEEKQLSLISTTI